MVREIRIGFVTWPEKTREDDYELYIGEDEEMARELASRNQVYTFSWKDVNQGNIVNPYDYKNRKYLGSKRISDFADVLFLSTLEDFSSEMPSCEEFMRRLNDLSLPVVNPVANYFALNNKSYLLKLRDKGIRIPRTEIASSEEQLYQLLSSATEERPLIVKPVIGQHSKGVELYPKTGLRESLASLKLGLPVLVQEFIPEILQGGEISIFCFGNQAKYVVRKVPETFRFDAGLDGKGPYAKSLEEIDLDNSDVDFAMRVLQTGIFSPKVTRVDLVRTSSDPVLMEISGVRPSLLFHDILNDGVKRPAQYLEEVLRGEAGI